MFVDIRSKKTLHVTRTFSLGFTPVFAIIRPVVGYLTTNLMLFINILRRLREIRGSQVVSFGTQYALPLILTKRLFRNLVIRVSGLDVSLHGLPTFLRPVLTVMNALLFKYSDKIICPSINLKRIVQRFAKKRDKIAVIPNLLDPQLYDITEGQSPLPSNIENIVFVGRFEKEKGLETLLNAFRNTVHNGFDVKLVLIGDGSLMPWIRNFIYENGLTKRVTLTGFIEQRKVYEFLKHGGIFVLPSFSEGMNNSLLQAMMLGLPVIVSNVAGNVELIKNGENGLVFPKGNVEKLSQAIIELLQRPELARELGKKAKESVMKMCRKAEELWLRSLVT